MNPTPVGPQRGLDRRTRRAARGEDGNEAEYGTAIAREIEVDMGDSREIAPTLTGIT